jgi:hypothetical protein
MENLIGQMVHVVVSKGGKSATKFLKVCKVKARSVLFIEVDKTNRINTFRKFNRKDIELQGTDSLTGNAIFYIKEGVLPDKWESSWDVINTNPVKMSAYGRKYHSNRSKGWASNAPQYNSTTNSSAGFPIV